METEKLSAKSYQLKAQIIGIDASRAFLKRRTGIEEYAYQVIRHLRAVIAEPDSVVLYVRKKLEIENWKLKITHPSIDFPLPSRWMVRAIWAPRFWTQIGLSIEMALHPPDVLFVPAHTVPIIHPARNATRLKRWLSLIVQKSIHPLTRCGVEHSASGGPAKTIVTIHGLEYEFCPEGYAWWERLYMRMSIRYSCRAAETVICVSENTRRDVMHLYGVPAERIRVVYEGYEKQYQVSGIPARPARFAKTAARRAGGRYQDSDTKYMIHDTPYLLFIGRLEERKNIVRIIEAFEVLKKKYAIPHDLILVGKPGFGYERIAASILNSQFSIHIKELGYVAEEEKWELLKNADVFLFPTLYEGFGIPVLEAQSVGVPVVTSDISSLPEVGGPPTISPDEIVLRAGGGAMFVDPYSVESITEGIQIVLSDKELRDGIIARGLINVERFSWQGCAEKIGEIFQK